jgi:hypothetical protein
LEGIIFAIIMLVIGMISKGKNTEETDGKTKPFMSKPLNQKPAKRIEDYAKEVFKEVQNQRSPRPESNRQTKSMSQTIDRAKPITTEIQHAKRLEDKPRKSTGRLSVHQKTDPVRNTKKAAPSLVPRTGHELIQAIVFSEILAPPKSKR